MTDAKRLPVIYLAHGTVEMLSDPEQYRYVANHYHHPDNEHTVPFEPAVGRCATCCRYGASDRSCIEFPYGMGGLREPTDFCSDYKPKEPGHEG